MRLALIALLAAALAGCGSGDDEITISDPPSPDTDLITFTRSGGIAFAVQEVQVDYDGSATLTNVEAGKPKTEDIELTEEQAEAVTEAVEAIDASELPEPEEGVCADCYTYSFVFGDGTEREYAQAPEPPAEIEPLLEEMLAILEANSPPNQTGG
jgi:hypothetical protein